MGHVQEGKRSKEMVSTMLERIKSPKITSFEHSDDYSREWFKAIYHLNRNLKLQKLNITGDMVLKRLR